MLVEDLDPAEGRAEALLLVRVEVEGHLPAAVGRGHVQRPLAALEDAQTGLRILGDAPLAPAPISSRTERRIRPIVPPKMGALSSLRAVIDTAKKYAYACRQSVT